MLCGALATVALAGCGQQSSTVPQGQSAATDFYRGKTISIVVGSGAGGGFDTTARLVARHIGKHIPGAPTVIVVNMPGGGGLVAANHVFSAAPKDGTVIGLFHEAQMMNQLTGGEGVAVAYDGIGAATFEASLACIRVRGMLVLFGAASGPVPPFDPQRLNPAGSLYLTRPSLGHYIRTRAELLEHGEPVLRLVAAGKLPIHIGGRFPLDQAAEAHRALESGQTTGKLLIIP